jgi:hypothetical protein
MVMVSGMLRGTNEIVFVIVIEIESRTSAGERESSVKK